jgi:hypothetical protein
MPVRSALRKLGVCVMILPPVAIKAPHVAFEMANEPPEPTVRLSMVTGPNTVIKGTTEKSPVPGPDTADPTADSIVLLSRLVPFPVTVKSTNGRDPEIALACITPLAATRRNKVRSAVRTGLFFMLAHSNVCTLTAIGVVAALQVPIDISDYWLIIIALETRPCSNLATMCKNLRTVVKLVLSTKVL